MLRKMLVWLAVGFAIGTFASMWFGPSLVTWWATPPAANTLMSCQPQIEWATTRLVTLQLATGGLCGLVGAGFIFLWSRRRPAGQSAAGPTP